jgi:hypothetical protein
MPMRTPREPVSQASLDCLARRLARFLLSPRTGRKGGSVPRRVGELQCFGLPWLLGD